MTHLFMVIKASIRRRLGGKAPPGSKASPPPCRARLRQRRSTMCWAAGLSARRSRGARWLNQALARERRGKRTHPGTLGGGASISPRPTADLRGVALSNSGYGGSGPLQLPVSASRRRPLQHPPCLGESASPSPAHPRRPSPSKVHPSSPVLSLPPPLPSSLR